MNRSANYIRITIHVPAKNKKLKNGAKSMDFSQSKMSYMESWISVFNQTKRANPICQLPQKLL